MLRQGITANIAFVNCQFTLDILSPYRQMCRVEIGSFSHKGLRRLYVDDDAAKVDATVADKLRLMLGFLQEMTSPAELLGPPKWKAHQLSEDRKGV